MKSRRHRTIKRLLDHNAFYKQFDMQANTNNGFVYDPVEYNKIYITSKILVLGR